MSAGGPAPATERAGIAIGLLPLAGLLTWFIVGLPWGPHTESFDWIVRLDTMSFAEAAFARLPSVLSLRPIGIGLAWLAYRIGGHDLALAQFANAALTLLAWWWLARSVAERRTFALVALLASGVCFAGYIYVFHLHGVFYAPLMLFLAGLLHLSRRPLTPGVLLRVLPAAAVAALAHPFALPIAIAFAVGALLEERRLRSPAGVVVTAVIVAGAAGLYLWLLPEHSRAPVGDPLHGWRVSLESSELDSRVSLVAGALAALAASGAARGAARLFAAVLAAAAAFGLASLGWPVLPVWFAAAMLACAVRGRWVLASLIAACVALPAANPTGSPTYAVFAIFLSAAATAKAAGVEDRLRGLDGRAAFAILLLAVAVGAAVRAGVKVPVVTSAVRPLVAERERTTQFPRLVRAYLDSEWGSHPLRFARTFLRPAEGDAMDRRFRPPTSDAHLATWLAHLRGGAAARGETLYVAFGGDPLVDGPVLLAVHGRVAGDALVFRRSPPPPAEAEPRDHDPDARP